jgi:hypothetical protein
LALGVNWDADFAGLPPIELADGRRLKTLGECAAYVLELPKREQDSPQWQLVTAELMKAAEHGSVFRFTARLCFSRTLHGISGVGPIPELPDDGAAWKAKRAKRQ